MIMSTDTEKHLESSSTIHDKNSHQAKNRVLKPTMGICKASLQLTWRHSWCWFLPLTRETRWPSPHLPSHYSRNRSPLLRQQEESSSAERLTLTRLEEMRSYVTRGNLDPRAQGMLPPAPSPQATGMKKGCTTCPGPVFSSQSHSHTGLHRRKRFHRHITRHTRHLESKMKEFA